MSCNSSHPLTEYGADGNVTSRGYKGQQGDRNSPTVSNAAAQFVQFWDGCAPDVESQAKGPMLNPVETAIPSAAAVKSVLRSMPEYVAAFRRGFPDEKNPVMFDHAAKAIGAFERRLVTPSRWEKFLRGDEAALTADEMHGYNLFIEHGCSSCHSGVLVGGEGLPRLGAATPYSDTADPGRYKVTQKETDRMVFKAPALRNVAQRAPYFHSDKIAIPAEAELQMGRYQVGRKIGNPDAQAIVTWPNTLTGDLPGTMLLRPNSRRAPENSEAGQCGLGCFMRKKTIVAVTSAIAVVLLGMQLYRPPRTNPPSDPADSFDAVVSPPAEVAAAIRRGCAECHSNQTSWPWYTHIAPASWLASLDVTEGRTRLNLSEWRMFGPLVAQSRLASMCSEVRAGEMPPVYFRIAHAAARWSAAETAALCTIRTDPSPQSRLER